MRVGFIGTGNIATIVMGLLEREKLDCEVTSVFDSDFQKADRFRKRFNEDMVVYTDIDSFLENVELVVEAASLSAVRDYGIRILEGGRDLIVMSTGALCDELLLQQMARAARENQVRVYIPSGGVGGVDGLRAACVDNVDQVMLITTKTPESLGSEVRERTVLYEGPVKEGIIRFPQNVNVAATLGLVAGFDKTVLKVVADPDIGDNMHEIIISGDFGEMRVSNVNKPSPHNPKTSYLAALSVVALLKRILGVVEIGT
ncbi:MAG: aspartate dehydrogenase [Candidatus Altiarchaeales archaeon ex4484_2]|nr:MAG: aspartate dehydrogenase [Candidatus Altiarchaeales archaeon ex4484_2]